MRGRAKRGSQAGEADCVCALGQVVNWMPQNNVLGHRQTRAFLSQCGANSLYEVCHAPDAP